MSFLSASDTRLSRTLAAIDATITAESSVKDIFVTLEDSKGRIHKLLENSVGSLPAKLLTIKIQNLFLSKYHFLARSTNLLSAPYGIMVDPMNACQLACPGCVHSARSKELKLFDWGPGVLSESTFADFMRRYGPYAIETDFYNYGEPLLNPSTPKLIRIAKTYLTRTALSTNMGVKHFDPEAYVASGLDYMTLSIDGATQSTYEKFRRKGDLEAVFRNIRSLMETRARMRKRTPLVSWQYLAFEHNEHEIEDAIKMAQRSGIDQFMLATPFSVSQDDPSIRPSKLAPRTLLLNPDAGKGAIENWNPFPSDIDAEPIERHFAADWQERFANVSDPGDAHTQPRAEHTCHYLYKTIVMDARGRILPCCGAPRPDIDLVFGTAQSGADVYNTEKYRLARLSFANPEQYRAKQASAGTLIGPYCENCDWNQDRAHIDKESLRNYFGAVGTDVFNPASIATLSSW
jgi:MoaA/NifB/PqqE/SkfB family radical SAM enzyme